MPKLVPSILALMLLVTTASNVFAQDKEINQPLTTPAKDVSVQGLQTNHQWTEEEVIGLYHDFLQGGYVQYPFTTDQIVTIITAEVDLPQNYLTAEIMTAVVVTHSQGGYYINATGLHWGTPSQEANSTRGGCYPAYAVSLIWTGVNPHFVFWLTKRPPSYDAYMGARKIVADPYSTNGILVQKRDVLITMPVCAVNLTYCVLSWVYVCAK